jgi:hypothetical protein
MLPRSQYVTPEGNQVQAGMGASADSKKISRRIRTRVRDGRPRTMVYTALPEECAHALADALEVGPESTPTDPTPHLIPRLPKTSRATSGKHWRSLILHSLINAAASLTPVASDGLRTCGLLQVIPADVAGNGAH